MIRPVCTFCGNELDQPGALIFGPPPATEVLTALRLWVETQIEGLSRSSDNDATWGAQGAFERTLRKIVEDCALGDSAVEKRHVCVNCYPSLSVVSTTTPPAPSNATTEPLT